MKRGQGAFEYILLLAGVLLIVVLAIIILRGTLTGAPGEQIGQAQCLAALSKASVCYNSTGGWNTGAGPYIAADYGLPADCLAAGGGLDGTSWKTSTSNFNCGQRPA